MTARIAQEHGSDKFDLVIVPRGTVDPKVVVGTIGANDVPTVRASRVRSAMRLWKIVGDDMVFVKSLAESGEVLEDSHDVQAHYLLKRLGGTLEMLAKAQSAFRVDLRAAIAEGDAMLSKVAG